MGTPLTLTAKGVGNRWWSLPQSALNTKHLCCPAQGARNPHLKFFCFIIQIHKAQILSLYMEIIMTLLKKKTRCFTSRVSRGTVRHVSLAEQRPLQKDRLGPRCKQTAAAPAPCVCSVTRWRQCPRHDHSAQHYVGGPWIPERGWMQEASTCEQQVVISKTQAPRTRFATR